MNLFRKIKTGKTRLFKTYIANIVAAIFLIFVLAITFSLPACTMAGGIGKLGMTTSESGSGDDSLGENNSDSGTEQGGQQNQVNGIEGTDSSGISIEKNLMIIGTDTTYPPFEFVENEEVVGFDLDLIKEVAARLDKQIEIVPIEWDPDFKALREGKVDIIISAVPYNIEKENLVDYSQTYFNMKYLLVSLNGSDIKVKEDIYGRKVGVLEATNTSVDAEYLMKFDIVKFTDVMDMIDALKNKELSAVLLSLPIAVNLLGANSEIYVVYDELESAKNFAIVFNEGSQLKQEVDAALAEITQDWTLGEIYKKWFDSF